MILRDLEVNDIPVMLNHMKGVAEEAGWIPRLAFDPGHIALSLTAFIQRPNVLTIGCLPRENGPLVGFLIADVGAPWYSPTPIASERVFYVHPSYRRAGGAQALINFYQQWADHHGAAEKLIGNGLGIEAEKVKALCERQGFTAIGYILKQVQEV